MSVYSIENTSCGHGYIKLGRRRPVFAAVCGFRLGWAGWLTLVLFALGLYGGLFSAPADAVQGNSFRIMYIHVPSAIWSMGVYSVMAVSALVFLVWKIKVEDMVVKQK